VWGVFTVLQSSGDRQAAVVREKRSQVETEIEGLKAQESAAARRVGIVHDEAATVAMLVEKGLERRPRLLNLEREAADIEGRRGEIVAQISRAEQVISESQRRFSNWRMIGKTRSHSHCARHRIRSFSYASDCRRLAINCCERR
jgi:hypothetical protein